MKTKSLVTKSNRRGAEAELRIAAVLNVAVKLFLKRGYAHTSLNDVISRSGGSKATLLKYFGSKAGLFAAAIDSVSQRFVATAHLAELKGSPTEVLTAFGKIVLRFYLAHDSLIAYRGIIAEGPQHPRMASAFYQQGHATVEAALAERLAAWRAQGLVHSTNCADDANLFLHLIRAGLHEQILLGVRKSASEQEITARVENSVRIYLHGIERPSRS